MRPDKDAEQIARQALDWLIALQEEPDSGAVRARFEAWHKARPEHVAAWIEAQHTWEVLGEAVPSPVVSQSLEDQRRSSALSSVRRSTAPHAAAQRTSNTARFLGVATAALVACFLLTFLPSLQLYLQADYLSSTGELRQVWLTDGSRAYLGAESALAVSYTPGTRRVRLLSGEAFFEVTPDPQRPFRVTAGQLDTTVVGTGFNVRLRADGVSVAVRHGAVTFASSAVSPPFAGCLQAGDWMRLSWTEGVVARGSLPSQQVAAWRHGQLIVKDWPIREVVAELRRYHHGLIILTDDKIGTLKVTGVYNLHDPMGSLRAVAQPYGAVVRQITSYLVFFSAS